MRNNRSSVDERVATDLLDGVDELRLLLKEVDDLLFHGVLLLQLGVQLALKLLLLLLQHCVLLLCATSQSL